jgi:glycosyltransferase involved in cell wall biosynthesis
MDISVYITSYNQENLLAEAIESALAQTLAPRQLIIVDDCSEDSSRELIKSYESRYPAVIQPILHEQNTGVAQVRIDALAAVTGEYVSYLDGDDRYLPEKLEKETALLTRRPETTIAFSNNYYIDQNGHRIGKWVTNDPPPQGDVFKETLTRQFPRGNLFRMELLPLAALKMVGFHDPNLHVLEDWEMRIRLSKRFQVAYWDEPLTEIRVHREGLSNVPNEKKLAAFEYIWQKHKSMLADLPVVEQQEIGACMDKLHASFLRRQAKEVLGAYANSTPGEKSQAWAFYRQSWGYAPAFDWDLLLGLILPKGVYGRLRQLISRRLGRIGAR